MQKHIAVYCRVSTTRQDTKSQLPELQSWADGQNEPARFYEDRFTGRTMERPGWNQLIVDVRSGHVSRVACWRLDRLGRTASGLTRLFEEFQSLGVGLVSIRDGVDLSTAAGRFMANVLASVGAYESEVRSERVRAGQAVAKANGKSWGGSRRGWRWKVTPEKIRAAQRMKADGEKVAAIARVLEVSRPTVYDMLRTDPAAC